MTDTSLLQDFIVETGEHLADTERNVLHLEQQPQDVQVLNEIFRSIHTIKGSSEYLGLERIAELSHKLENLLDLLRRGERRVESGLIDLLIGTNDRLAQLVDELARHQQERSPIDDLVARIEEYCGKAAPVSVPEAGENPAAQGDGDVIQDEYDEELFGIFLDQLKSGLQAVLQDTRRLLAGEEVEKTLARCEDRLATLRSSANYMGYEKLKQVFVQWSQALAAVSERLERGEAVDWPTVARDIGAASLERVKRFFPQVEFLQQLEMHPDEPDATPTVCADADAQELGPDVVGLETATQAEEDASPELALFSDPQGYSSDREHPDPPPPAAEKADRSLLQDFLVETGEHLADTERNLLRLEQQSQDVQVLNEIFRSIHTIKGSSEYLGLERIAGLSHKLENLLDLLRRGERRIESGLIDLLIGTNDRLAQLVDELARHQQERSSIDDLMDQIEEYCGKAEPAAALEAGPDAASQDADGIQDEYDEELFGIFLDQLKSGLEDILQDTRQLSNGAEVEKILAHYEDRLATLSSSANYMGYEKLKQLYAQWGQSLAAAAERHQTGAAVDWRVFAQEVTAAFFEQVRRLFPKVDFLQQWMPAVDEPEADSADDMLVDFIAESHEQLEEIENNLLRLEQHAEPADRLKELFRSVHTIKGSAQYLGIGRTAELSHRLENLLDQLRQGAAQVDSATLDLLRAAKERIAQLVDDLVGHRSEKTPIDDLLLRIESRCSSPATPEAPPPTAQAGPAPAPPEHTVYEETYDRDLFAIFTQQLVQGLGTLEKETAGLKAGKNAQAVLDTCEKQLHKLQSSANYMDYLELKEIYGLWLAQLTERRRQLQQGKAVDWTDWVDRVVPQTIACIRSFFNWSELSALQEEAGAAAAEADDQPAEAILAAPAQAAQDPPALPETLAGEVPCAEERSLLEQLEKAFDAKVGSDAGTSPDDAFKAEVVKELLSGGQAADPAAPDLAAPDLPVQEAGADLPVEGAGADLPVEEAGAEAGGTESLLFSDPHPLPAPARPATLARLLESQDPLASLAEGDAQDRRSRFALGRRQTDKFRDRLLKQTIRVDAGKIDALMNQVGELVVTRAGFNQLFSEMRELQLMLKQVQKPDSKVSQTIKSLTNRINAATLSLARITSELQENVMKVRMLPIAQLFSRYPRVVHDLVRNTQKQVELDIRGEETELDRMVIEQISDPLMHIIRNAVDHGIEPVPERQRKGKPEAGTLRLEAFHEGNNVVIEISDDGRGIDAEKIKERALARGFAGAEELQAMSAEELTALIMRPGFSTADEVTLTSGRGVGMDVVKDHMDKLNGVIAIESTPGRGTLFRIKIPLTLAIIQALMVGVAGETFTIPLSAVAETIHIRQEDIATIEGMEVYYLREQALPLIRLNRVFKMGPRENARDLFVVVVHTGNRQVGLVVDQLKGREEVVIKPLEDYLQEKSGFSGATILGDGSISLILDVGDLVNLAVDQQVRRTRVAV